MNKIEQRLGYAANEIASLDEEVQAQVGGPANENPEKTKRYGWFAGLERRCPAAINSASRSAASPAS